MSRRHIAVLAATVAFVAALTVAAELRGEFDFGGHLQFGASGVLRGTAHR